MIEEIGAHPSDGRPLLQMETQEEWRAWLEQNQVSSPGIWLVSWKQGTGKPFVPYSDSVDEALCFGWIDSRVNALDDERAMRLFTRRNPKSPWSRINKDKAVRLMRQGRMMESGASIIAAAQSNGAWTIYDEIEDLGGAARPGCRAGPQRGRPIPLRQLPALIQKEHPVVDQIRSQG